MLATGQADTNDPGKPKTEDGNRDSCPAKQDRISAANTTGLQTRGVCGDEGPEVMTEGLAEQMNRSQAACTWQPRGRTHRIARRSRRAHNRNRRSDPLHRNLVPRRKTPWDVEIVYDTGPTSTEQIYEEPCREQAESMQYFPENEDYLPATSLQ